MTVWIMSVEDGPTGLQVNREWSGPHLWELSLPDGYRYAHREEKPAFLVCSKADYQVVEKREFVRRGAKSPSTFYRTRNQTTMTVYEAKGGTSLHTAEFTGPEPVAFPAEIGDRLGVEFVGGIDRVKRRAALKEGLP